MRLKKIHITNFRSIEDSTEVEIEPDVTCLVGKNESGKTAALKALHRLNPEEKDVSFSITKDYPRRRMTKYEQNEHEQNPAIAITTLFELSEQEVQSVENLLGSGTCPSRELRLSKGYDNVLHVGLQIEEVKVIENMVSDPDLDPRARDAAKGASTLSEFSDALENLAEETPSAKALAAKLKEYAEGPIEILAWERCLKSRLPMFMFFDDYGIMSGSASLDVLATEDARKQRNLLPLLDLLEIAGTGPQALKNEPNKYEEHKARLESAANQISDEVFAYWSQNKQLEVEFDVAASDPAQKNQQILHVRIRNHRHRMTVPFDERSRGFVWFFSFLARFDRIAHSGKPLIILLDEPALNLHASAQADFLRFIEERLAPNHQVIYTTHSPFMVDAAKLHRVRTVEDLEKKGTVISKDVLVADHATAFPLQAALGYTMAQSLFIGPNTVLVEGASDLIYLQIMSELLRQAGRTSLNPKWVITPVGGADRLAVFATLLGANKLNVAVLMDFSGQDLQRLKRLLDERRLDPKNIIRVSEVLGPVRDADIEDLFDPASYLRLVQSAFPGAGKFTEADLPPDSRMVRRYEKFFAAKELHFDHFAPAQAAVKEFVRAAPGAPSLENFEKVFARLNGLLV